MLKGDFMVGVEKAAKEEKSMGRVIKDAGFDSQADLASWSTFSRRTLLRWFNENRQRFDMVLAGAKALKNGSKYGEPSLPPVKDDLHISETLAKPSIDVLVRVDGFIVARAGRFFHGMGEWQIDGISGFYKPEKVSEWWYFPDFGTGIKPVSPNVNKDEVA